MINLDQQHRNSIDKPFGRLKQSAGCSSHCLVTSDTVSAPLSADIVSI
jgi:hypothetical protein